MIASSGFSAVTQDSGGRARLTRFFRGPPRIHSRLFQVIRPVYRSFLSIARIVPWPQPRPAGLA